MLMPLVFILLVYLPCLSSPMTVYFIDEVLRYRLKNRRIVYIISIIFALMAGTFFAFVDGYYGQVKSTFEVTNLPMLILSVVMMLVIAFNMQNIKVWRRIVVTAFATGIINNIHLLFGGIREELFLLIEADDAMTRLLVYLGYEVAVLTFEFLFFLWIANLRRRNDDVPLPIPVVIWIDIILNLFTNLINDGSMVKRESSPLVIISLLSALAFVLILFYVRAARNERNGLIELNRRNEEFIETEAKYFELSAKSDDTIRAMKHDMRNNIQVLMLLLQNGEYDEMGEYLEQMGANLESADISAHTGNMIADAIIADKKNRAQSEGAELKVSGTISGVEFTPVDMCKILANILDNAIEAVSDSRIKDLPDDVRKIVLTFRRTDKFFLITLTNPCADRPVITEDGIETAKPDKKEHGFGIKNVKEASEVYGGDLNLSYESRSYGYEFRTEILFDLSI